MCIQNKQLFNKGFWDSFNHLMSLKSLELKDKLSLVKTRKILTEHYEEVLGVVKDNEMKKEEIEVLMKEDYNFHLNKIDVNKVQDDLGSNDIYNLEFLFKELGND